jgi:protein-S-isoprenylcysteine O-methyltransferase Ste14
MVVATLFEEADLVAEFGDAYRSYRRAVPMLIPIRKPGTAGASAAVQ